MEPMRGADAYFLHEESRDRHMHTLKIVVVDPSSAHEKLSFERVRTGAALVMPHLAAFRRRPARAGRWNLRSQPQGRTAKRSRGRFD